MIDSYEEESKREILEKYPELLNVQKTELEILLCFDEVCQKNNLCYGIDYGTLLGAVRHGGFIPWDDDIDVTMPYKDYKKFLNIAEESFDENYFVQTRDTDPNYTTWFAKIRKNGTKYIQFHSKDIKMNHGVWIDIFPFFLMPNDKKKRKRYVKRCLRLISIMNLKYIPCRFAYPENSLSWKAKDFTRKCIHYILKIIPDSLIDKKVEKEFTRYEDTDPSEKYYWFGGRTEPLREEELFPYNEIEFEGYMFKCPNKVEDVLTKRYGDYMKLPPKEERVGHRPIIVEI